MCSLLSQAEGSMVATFLKNVSFCKLSLFLSLSYGNKMTNKVCQFTFVRVRFNLCLRLCFHRDNFGQIKSEKSRNAVKTVHIEFSELKMHAVFTRKK